MSGAPEPMANPVDLHVGHRIRSRRKSLGMSQSELAARLGLTFQQIQKYERGSNRVSASKLYETARALNVPLTDFFEGLPPTKGGDGAADMPEPQPNFDRLMDTRDGQELAELFPQIDAPGVRRALIDVVRGLVRAKKY
jgi:transcriptional regulator with XRE-family HTH domain